MINMSIAPIEIHLLRNIQMDPTLAHSKCGKSMEIILFFNNTPNILCVCAFNMKSKLGINDI